MAVEFRTIAVHPETKNRLIPWKVGSWDDLVVSLLELYEAHAIGPDEESDLQNDFGVRRK